MAFRVTGLHHVQITVPHAAEAAAIRLYRDLLALPEIPQPRAQAGQGGVWLQLPNGELHLKPEDIDAAATRGSKRHVCLAMDDLAACRTAMETAGLEILPDERPIPGMARFVVRDPGGNRLEVTPG